MHSFGISTTTLLDNMDRVRAQESKRENGIFCSLLITYSRYNGKHSMRTLHTQKMEKRLRLISTVEHHNFMVFAFFIFLLFFLQIKLVVIIDSAIVAYNVLICFSNENSKQVLHTQHFIVKNFRTFCIGPMCDLTILFVTFILVLVLVLV